ncbi:endoribonuclease YbeY [Tateyamaria omphalii]|uniref:rRNA maturation RNase YbeY n=1 Tax=Tateyamaria omphalii TaxID=299262 RepID=UPI00167874B9|nr:rRNA maturation RNase YbeY [Tateyamaria omphalii]GGX51659.1 endoribonuclease YbeY [Tateyamaria omphalii]
MPHEIDILIEDSRWQDLGLEALADTAICGTLSALDVMRAELSVLACDDARISVLNADFRNKAVPTNVLSWPEEDLSSEIEGAAPVPPRPDPSGTISLGDIAIAYDTCAREAAEQSKPLADHVTHLLVHGTLHLLGYDHIRDHDATRMETLEVEILGKLGVSDPY